MTQKLEGKIDRLVYQLCGIIEEEIKIIPFHSMRASPLWKAIKTGQNTSKVLGTFEILDDTKPF